MHMVKLLVRSGLIGLLMMGVSLSAQNRGTAGARGGTHGNSEEMAAKRSAIQAQEKAAIEQENRAFKSTMDRIQSDRKTSTSDVERDLLKARTGAAQREHQAALQKIRSEGQAAMAALRH
jgi:hypothetical protein